MVAARLSRAGAGLPPAVRRPLPARSSPADDPANSAFIDVLYLIAAMRWTLALTAIAFVGGGLVGLVDRAAARLRRSRRCAGSARSTCWSCRARRCSPGCSSSSSACRSSASTVSPWIAAAASYSIYAGAFLGEIWRGCLQAIPKHAVGGRRLARPLASPQQLRYIIVPQAHAARHPADGRLPGAADQEHLARRRDRLHRADPRGPAHHRDDLPPLHRLSHRGRALLRCSASR